MSKLALALAHHLDISQNHAKTIADAIGPALREAMAAGPTDVPGLGRFRLVDKPARPVRNPKTGEQMMTKPRVAVRFTERKSRSA